MSRGFRHRSSCSSQDRWQWTLAAALWASGDVGAQTTQVFSNLGQILTSVGATFRNVVEFNVYLVGRSSIQPYMGARTEILRGAFPEGDYPPSTLVVVDGLATEEYLVEIKAVAALS